MKKISLLISLSVLLLSACVKEPVDLGAELLEGAWLFQKVEDQSQTTTLDGSGEPQMIFFFLEDGRLKGRLKGTYQISNDELYIKADIDSFAIVYGWELQLLNGFPQRYEDLASLLKEGIRGPMTFLENGFDSQFYVEFGQGDKIWFERY